jgi:hypothetical protein
VLLILGEVFKAADWINKTMLPTKEYLRAAYTWLRCRNKTTGSKS